MAQNRECVTGALDLRVQLKVWLFCLTINVHSCGHVETVSSPIHTFFQDMLNLAVNQYFVHV